MIEKGTVSDLCRSPADLLIAELPKRERFLRRSSIGNFRVRVERQASVTRISYSTTKRPVIRVHKMVYAYSDKSNAIYVNQGTLEMENYVVLRVRNWV